MAMAVTNNAMLVTMMMERRLLHECRGVARMNASKRDGIRRTRRTKSKRRESRCGQDRLHVLFSSSEQQAGATCKLCCIASDATAAHFL
jgi:hypothetical protein